MAEELAEVATESADGAQTEESALDKLATSIIMGTADSDEAQVISDLMIGSDALAKKQYEKAVVLFSRAVSKLETSSRSAGVGLVIGHRALAYHALGTPGDLGLARMDINHLIELRDRELGVLPLFAPSDRHKIACLLHDAYEFATAMKVWASLDGSQAGEPGTKGALSLKQIREKRVREALCRQELERKDEEKDLAFSSLFRPHPLELDDSVIGGDEIVQRLRTNGEIGDGIEFQVTEAGIRIVAARDLAVNDTIFIEKPVFVGSQATPCAVCGSHTAQRCKPSCHVALCKSCTLSYHEHECGHLAQDTTPQPIEFLFWRVLAQWKVLATAKPPPKKTSGRSKGARKRRQDANEEVRNGCLAKKRGLVGSLLPCTKFALVTGATIPQYHAFQAECFYRDLLSRFSLSAFAFSYNDFLFLWALFAQHGRQTRDEQAIALYETEMLMQHSCVPNVLCVYDDAANCFKLHAKVIRPVATGETLTIARVDPRLYVLLILVV